MGYRETAQLNADNGHNCCQSVFLTFCKEFGLDSKLGLMLSGGLGAGFSRRGEVCGAVSGAILALGLHEGFYDPAEPESKTIFVKKVRAFMDEFEAKHGTIICRELLNFDISAEESYARAANEGIFAGVCRNVIGDAADMIQNYFDRDTSAR